ncbi:hypothetical protein [Nocardia concava]|uniref:hypothetical protein n=1 Tax=Nocardia concava TaxID=257281 RepID=UPI00157A504D|nr:hypothetical protein [Nocardia concava]
MVCDDFSGVRAQLDRIAVLFDESTMSLAAARRRGPGERVTRSRARDASVNFEVLEARTEITAVLASWAGLVTSERAVPPLRTLDIVGLTGFLAAHLDWLAAHPAAGDFAEELADLARRAVAAVDADPLSGPVRACPAPECAGSLEIAGDAENPSLNCESGHSWAAGDWLGLTGETIAGPSGKTTAPDDRRRTVPTKAAARALCVSEATIRQWVRRGKLTRHGPAHRAEFDIEELAALSAAESPARK